MFRFLVCRLVMAILLAVAVVVTSAQTREECEAQVNARNSLLMDPQPGVGWAFDTNETLYRHLFRPKVSFNTRECPLAPLTVLIRGQSYNYCFMKSFFAFIEQFTDEFLYDSLLDASDSGNEASIPSDQIELIKTVKAFISGPDIKSELETFDFDNYNAQLPICYSVFLNGEQSSTSSNGCGQLPFLSINTNFRSPLLRLVAEITANPDGTLTDIFLNLLQEAKDVCARGTTIRIVRPYDFLAMHGIDESKVSNAYDSDPKLGTMLAFRDGKTYTVVATMMRGIPFDVVYLCLVDHANPQLYEFGTKYSKYIQSNMGEMDLIPAQQPRYRRNRLAWYFGGDGNTSPNYDGYERLLAPPSEGMPNYAPTGLTTDEGYKFVFDATFALPAREIRRDTRYSDFSEAMFSDVFAFNPEPSYLGLPYNSYFPYEDLLRSARYTYAGLDWDAVDLPGMPFVEGFGVCGCNTSPHSRVDLVNGEVVCMDVADACSEGTALCPIGSKCTSVTRVGYVCEAIAGYTFNIVTGATKLFVFDPSKVPKVASSVDGTILVKASNSRVRVYFNQNLPSIQLPTYTFKPYLAYKSTDWPNLINGFVYRIWVEYKGDNRQVYAPYFGGGDLNDVFGNNFPSPYFEFLRIGFRGYFDALLIAGRFKSPYKPVQCVLFLHNFLLAGYPAEPDTASRDAKFYLVKLFVMESSSRSFSVGSDMLVRAKSMSDIDLDDIPDLKYYPGARIRATFQQVQLQSRRIPAPCWFYAWLETQDYSYYERQDRDFLRVNFFGSANSYLMQALDFPVHNRFSEAIDYCRSRRDAFYNKYSDRPRILDSDRQSMSNIGATFDITFNLACGCETNDYDVFANDGKPLDVTATQDRALVTFAWRDNSLCETRYSVIRIDARKFNPYVNFPPEQSWDKRLRDFNLDSDPEGCGTMYSPTADEGVADDISKIGVGEAFWYCIRARAPKTRISDEYLSGFSCTPKPLFIRFQSEILVQVSLRVRSLRSSNVKVSYQVVLPISRKSRFLLAQGQVITDALGQARIPIDIDPQQFPPIFDRRTLPVYMTYEKVSGANTPTPIIHQFLCDGSTRNCTLEQPEVAYAEHLSFGILSEVIDATSMPIRGKAMLGGTTNCPLEGVQICLYLFNSATPLPNCTVTAQDGTFTLQGPMGAIVVPTATYQDKPLRTPNSTVRLVSTVLELNGVDFFYEEQDDLFVQVSGTECQYRLVDQVSVTLTRFNGCSITRPLSALSSTSLVYQTMSKVPAINFTVEISGPVRFMGQAQVLSPSDLTAFLNRVNTDGGEREIDLFGLNATGIDAATYVFQRLVQFAFSPDPTLVVEFLRFPSDQAFTPLMLENYSPYVFNPSMSIPSVCSRPGQCTTMGTVATTDKLGVRVSVNVSIPSIGAVCDRAPSTWRAVITNKLTSLNGSSSDSCYYGCDFFFNNGSLFYLFSAVPTNFKTFGIVSLKTFDIGLSLSLADDQSSELVGARKNCFIVTGIIPNPDQGQSVPITNFRPIAMLRDPPGSLSYAYARYLKTTMEFVSVLDSDDTRERNWAKNELGVYLKVGTCFGANVFLAVQNTCLDLLEFKQTWALGNPSFNEKTTIRKTKTDTGVSITWTYSMETDATGDTLPGPDSDVFLVPALTMKFSQVDTVVLNNTVCSAITTKFVYDVTPSKSEAGLTWISRRDVVQRTIPNITRLADEATDANAKNVLLQALNAWQQAVDYLPEDPSRRSMFRMSSFSKMKATMDKYTVNTEEAGADELGEALKEEMDEPFDLDEKGYSSSSITFVGGGSLFSYEIDQTLKEAVVSGIRKQEEDEVENSFDLDLGITVVGFESQTESSGSEVGLLQVNLKHEVTRHTTMGFVLGDSTLGDEFTIDVYDDFKYGTFIFDLIRGRSACPHEPGTIAREDPRISVTATQGSGIHPDEDALYSVQITNAGDQDWGVEVFTDAKTYNGKRLELQLNGVSLSNRPFVLESLRKGMTADFLLALKRGQDVFDFSNVVVGVRSLCESTAFLPAGVLLPSQIVSQTRPISASFSRFCPAIQLDGQVSQYAEADAELLVGAGNSTVLLQVRNMEITPLSSFGSFVSSLRFEYKSWEYSESPWVAFSPDLIPMEDPVTRIASYVWNVSTIMTSNLWVRATTTCNTANIQAQMDPRLAVARTKAVKVRIDKLPPRVFAYYPALNANYFPDKPISVDFDEEVRCSEMQVDIVINAGERNISSALGQVLISCEGNHVDIQIDRVQVPFRELTNKNVALGLKNVRDLAGNTLQPSFLLTFSFAKVDLVTSNFKLTGLILPATVASTKPGVPKALIKQNITQYIASALGNITLSRITLTAFNFVSTVGWVVDLTVAAPSASTPPTATPTNFRRILQSGDDSDLGGLVDQAVQQNLLALTSTGSVDVATPDTPSGPSDVVSLAISSGSSVAVDAMDQIANNISAQVSASLETLLDQASVVRSDMVQALLNVSELVNATLSSLSGSGPINAGGGDAGSQNVGAIVGAAVGASVATFLLTALVGYVIFKRRMEEARSEERVHARTGDFTVKAYNPGFSPHPVFNGEEGIVTTLPYRPSTASNVDQESQSNPVFVKEKSVRMSGSNLGVSPPRAPGPLDA